MAERAGLPAILLIYNTIDPHQDFGTESHDFFSAMYGEMTVRLADNQPCESFHGRNAKLRNDENCCFSAVGHLRCLANRVEVKIYENVYAQYPLPFQDIPSCIELVRVYVDDNQTFPKL